MRSRTLSKIPVLHGIIVVSSSIIVTLITLLKFLNLSNSRKGYIKLMLYLLQSYSAKKVMKLRQIYDIVIYLKAFWTCSKNLLVHRSLKFQVWHHFHQCGGFSTYEIWAYGSENFVCKELKILTFSETFQNVTLYPLLYLGPFHLPLRPHWVRLYRLLSISFPLLRPE